jgi:ribonuclease VapC
MTDRCLVLDAWPVMEWFRRREPARAAFRELLSEAARGRLSLCMSRINLGEIYYSIAKDYDDATAAALVQQLTAIFVEIVPVTDADIDAAAKLKAHYRISYADAFAVVLSINRSATLVTGDPDFLPLASDDVVQLHWIGA